MLSKVTGPQSRGPSAAMDPTLGHQGAGPQQGGRMWGVFLGSGGKDPRSQYYLQTRHTHSEAPT